MEFLKSVFGEGALTFDEFAVGVAQNGLKLADLAAGGYVDKRKVAGRIAEMEEALRLRDEEDVRRSEDALLTRRIVECVGDRKFAGEYVKNAVISDVKALLAQDGTRSVKEAFAEVVGDKEGVFVSQNPAVVMDGIGSVETAFRNGDAIRHVMGLGTINN